MSTKSRRKALVYLRRRRDRYSNAFVRRQSATYVSEGMQWNHWKGYTHESRARLARRRCWCLCWHCWRSCQTRICLWSPVQAYDCGWWTVCTARVRSTLTRCSYWNCTTVLSWGHSWRCHRGPQSRPDCLCSYGSKLSPLDQRTSRKTFGPNLRSLLWRRISSKTTLTLSLGSPSKA